MSSLFHPRFSHAEAPGFSSLFRLLDDFDRYAGSTQGSTSVTSFSPKFDVSEHGKEYLLQGELPGIPPENVEIEFTDEQTLVVRGRAERQHTEGDAGLLEAPQETKQIEGAESDSGASKGAAVSAKGQEPSDNTSAARPKPKYWLSERSYGEFSRVFTFPAPVDQDGVQAKFKNGVLDITVPKAQRRGGRKIAIN